MAIERLARPRDPLPPGERSGDIATGQVVDAVQGGNSATAEPIGGVLTARRLAAAFVLYGLVATGFLAINMPPFQGGDEGMQWMRAAMLADEKLFGTRYTQTDADGSQHVIGGGPADPRLLEAWMPFLTALRL